MQRHLSPATLLSIDMYVKLVFDVVLWMLYMVAYVVHIACIPQHGVTCAHHSKLPRHAVTHRHSQKSYCISRTAALQWLTRKL